MALGFMMMPAPTGLSCAARSSTVHERPRRCSSRASDSPPMPPPTTAILMSEALLGGRVEQVSRLQVEGERQALAEVRRHAARAAHHDVGGNTGEPHAHERLRAERLHRENLAMDVRRGA